MAEDRTELDVAKAIRDGELPSGQQFANLWLFAMRISGTGTAYRSADNGYTWRDPKEWTDPEFLARFNGLPVILDHPIVRGSKGEQRYGLLNSDDYSNRTVGAIMLPYVKNDEPWGIARIQDDAVAGLLKEVQLSTSPGIGSGSSNLTIKLDDGSKLLVEGKPRLVCHLAICRQGVWDKGGEPTGIDGGLMTDDEKKEKDKADAEAKAKADAAAAAAAKVKADEEKQEKDPADKEKEKLDAEAKATQAKLDAMQSRLDAYEAAEKEREKEKSDAAKAKADADDAEKEKEKEREDRAKADAEAFKAMQAKVDAVLALHAPRTETEEAALAGEQAKADAVEQAWGRSAPRYQPNETTRGYIIRSLHEHKQHSAAWKDVDLSKLPVDVLGVAAAQIRADSVTASRNPSAAPADQLIRRTRASGTGHMITEYFGDVHTEMAPFRIPPRFAALQQQSRG